MTLADCDDVLTLPELLAVLKIKKSTYYNRKAHGVFPIPQLEGLGGVKFSKTAVERYLASITARRLPSVRLKAHPARLNQQGDKFINGER